MVYTSYGSYGFGRVLELLKSHRSEYISGQDLSDVLKISRVAVWKHIRRIRSLGYAVESRQKLGYRLVGQTRLPLPWEITEGLDTEWIGKRITYFDEIGSTQEYALRIAADAGENGAVIVARRQTDGRGRADRAWISPDGGAWLSVIIRPGPDFCLTGLFPLAAAVALAESMEDVMGVGAELKWPNDVLVDGRKAAGILTDVSLTSDRVDHMVLGAGINIDVEPREIEGRIGGRGVYSLTSSDGADGAALVRAFLGRLEDAYGALASGRQDDIRDRWTARSHTVGREVEIETDGGTASGRAVGIDSDGALLLSDGRSTRRVVAGDVR